MRQRDADEFAKTTAADDNEEEGTIGPDSWSKKIPKLIWRGVPMVEVRQVSPTFLYAAAAAISCCTGVDRNSCERLKVSPGLM